MKAKHIIGIGLLGASGSAFAHVGAGLTEGFTSGLLHPLTGLDHLLAMIAVGVWAATLGQGQKKMAVPAAFVIFMMLGAFMGMNGMALPLVETGIAFSVVLLGLLLLTRAQPPVALASLLVGGFALAHGNAHGLEAAAGTAIAAYMLGFVVTTISLHLFGMRIGDRLLHNHWALRAMGLAAGVAGTGLLIMT